MHTFTTRPRSLRNTVAVALLAVLVGIFGLAVPVGPAAAEPASAHPAPTVSIADSVDGNTALVSWPDGSVRTEMVAVLAAPAGAEADPSSWTRIDRFASWSPTGVLINPASVPTPEAMVYAFSEVDAAGNLLGVSDWSAPIAPISEVNPQVASRASGDIMPLSSGPETWCDGDAQAPPCDTSGGWPDGQLRSNVIGVADGCDVIPRTQGAYDMCGAYVRGVRHLQSVGGPSDRRNPYGWGYCMDDGAVASSTQNPVPQPIPTLFQTGLDSAGGRPRMLLANWILTHFGNPSVWETDRPGHWTTQHGLGIPNVTAWPDDRLVVGGSSYTVAERVAAVNVAVKLVLWGGHGGVVDGPAQVSAFGGLADLRVAVLANWMRDRAIEFAWWNHGLTLTPTVNAAGNQVTVRATNADGHPVPHVAIHPVIGEHPGVNGFTVVGPEAPAGLSYDETVALWGGGYSNANGEVTFNLNAPGSWSMGFFSNAAGNDIRLYAGISGSQINATTGQVIVARTQAAYSEASAQAMIRKTTPNPVWQSGFGATFTLRSGGPAGPIVGTLETGPGGVSNVLILPAGTYHIAETNVPEGQTNNFAPRLITLNAGERLEIEAENGVLREAQLELIKEDPDGNTVPGAHFEVRFDHDGTSNGPDGIYGTADDRTDAAAFATLIPGPGPGGVWVSESTPVVIDNLLIGNYRIEEVAPPPGFGLPDPDDRVWIDRLTYNSLINPDDNHLSATIVAVDPPIGIDTRVVDGTSGADANAFELPAPIRELAAVLDCDQLGRTDIAVGDPDYRDDLDPDGTGFACYDDGLADDAPTVSVSDRVTVTGAATDQTGTITTSLYGPFDGDATFECTADNLFATLTTTTVGSGEFTVGEFLVGESGRYTFVSRWTDSFGESHTHPCGVPTESFYIPEIATQVSDQQVTVGSTVTDTAELTGVPAEVAGTITVNLYGPFESFTDIECVPGTLYATSSIQTVGSGTFISDGHLIDDAGIFTFVEEWAPEDGSTRARHRCGETTETLVVHPTLTTEVSDQEVTVGGTVSDVAELVGVPDGVTGEIVFAIYGPFDSHDAIDCAAGDAYATVTVDTDGSGTFTSPDVAIDDAGVFTFVATWTSTSGELTATHDCGVASETLVASHPDLPPPVIPPDDSSQGGGGVPVRSDGGGALPVTGTNTVLFVVLGLLLAATGVAFVGVSRGRREET